jgi:hypothetical protein
MKLMLAKSANQRVFQCIDCGLPDPMASEETTGWLKGELAPKE